MTGPKERTNEPTNGFSGQTVQRRKGARRLRRRRILSGLLLIEFTMTVCTPGGRIFGDDIVSEMPISSAPRGTICAPLARFRPPGGPPRSRLPKSRARNCYRNGIGDEHRFSLRCVFFLIFNVFIRRCT